MPMSVAPEILLESKNQGKSPSLQLSYDFFELVDNFVYNNRILYRDNGNWGWFICRIRYQLTVLVAIRKNLLQDHVPGHDLGILV